MTAARGSRVQVQAHRTISPTTAVRRTAYTASNASITSTTSTASTGCARPTINCRISREPDESPALQPFTRSRVGASQFTDPDEAANEVEQLVGRWIGLATSATARESPGETPFHSITSALADDHGAEVPGSAASTLASDKGDSTDWALLPSAGKRPSQGGSDKARMYVRPTKKARLRAPGHLRLSPTPPSDYTLARSDVPSPLFFSHSSKHMARQSTVTASEVAASMMGSVHDTVEGVTTLRLPKGQVSAVSLARSTSTPGSMSSSSELPSTTRSPDGRPLPSMIQLLQGVGVIELLEQDERPTFIIDLANPANFEPGPLQIVYANASLRAASAVSELVQADTTDPQHGPDFSRFKAWTVSFVKAFESMDVCLPSLTYGGVSWACSTLRRRFRFISGNMSAVSHMASPPGPMAQPVAQPVAQGSAVLEQRLEQTRGRTQCRGPTTPHDRAVSECDYFGDDGRVTPCTAFARAASEPRSMADSMADAVPTHEQMDLSLISGHEALVRTTFDWTRIPLNDANLGAHHRFARSVDWASTPLGPIDEWPSDLRIMSNMIMGSPHPAALYWGEDYTAIFNEAYIPLAGEKHQRLMGSSYRDIWDEIWDELKPVFDGAWQNGDATMKEDDRLIMVRNGFLEETYFNWSIVPLVGDDGSVVALYNPAFENTRRKVNERRMLTMHEVGEKTSRARDVKSFWRQVQLGLESNEFDVPFALIYSVGEEAESESSSMHSGSLSNPPQILLEGSLGVPPDHALARSCMDLKSGHEGFAPHIRDALTHGSGNPIVLHLDDGSLPRDLVQGLAWRGFGDPCRTIVIFPVHPTTASETTVGFLVLGVNPRRPYDQDYQLFVSLLSRQLATSLASVVLFEEEIKRGQRAARLAALDRQELSMQLRLRTQEAVESEYRFTRMAELGPVGMFIADGQGHINYCNDMWWKISGHGRTTSTLDAWMQSIRPEDRAGVESAWRQLVKDKIAITHEFRFKASQKIIDGHAVDTWALMSAYPEKDDVGNLKSIFGCITDISQQKWAEDFQKQRREEAVELKRQQENFIDITSHEMRNPLSAILQCADEIASGLGRYQTENVSHKSCTAQAPLFDSCIEAANTIALCASHQKRIVDDILTLSKLDSNLLLVTPVDARPIEVVQQVLRMFDAELKTNDIRGEFHIQDSYRELDLDWVKIDPSRLLQVLINLMTNAIKFTQGRERRLISVYLGASRNPPDTAGLAYIPPRHPNQADITNQTDWADGEKVNLHLAVTDTGPGLDEDEKKILFQRFSQATPRTHVQYGGSGLGLFICRILTELQGGQIGVKTAKGIGSTFAFYVKCRRAACPHPPAPANKPSAVSTPLPSPARLTCEAETETISPVMTEAGPETSRSPIAPLAALPPPSSPATAAAAAAAAATATATAPAPPSRGRSLNILIVEDNIVNQKVLQRQLRVAGNNVFVANHGGEALDTLRHSRYWNVDPSEMANMISLESTSSSNSSRHGDGKVIDISVILMDLEMPVMDGMSCTREIRRLEEKGALTCHIPIIAVTAYARPEQIDDAKVAGVDDVISKPFRIPELLPKIEELIAKHNTQPCRS